MGHILQKISDFFKRTKSEPLVVTRYDPQLKYVDYSHLYATDNFFTDEFYLNLIRTINWTENIIAGIDNKTPVNYSTILRLTNPQYEGKPFYTHEDTWSGYAATPEISFNYLTVLNEALTVRKDTTFAVKDFTLLGQMLEFNIDLTTHDGAPCAESEGYVDQSDIPPIDTWFYLTKTKLYCWTPAIFIGKMQGAMDVEIFDSYRWIKDANQSLQLQTTDKLKAAYNRGLGTMAADTLRQ